MAQQGIPQIGEDVTALMPGVGEDVTHLMDSSPELTPEQQSQQQLARARETAWEGLNPVNLVRGVVGGTAREVMASAQAAREGRLIPMIGHTIAAHAPVIGPALADYPENWSREMAAGEAALQRAKDKGLAGIPDAGAALAHAFGAVIPVLGPVIGDITSKMESGDTGGAAGTLVSLGLGPKIYGGAAATTGNLAKSTVAKLAKPVGEIIESRAVPMVSSALKAPWAAVKRRAQIEGLSEPEVLKKQVEFIIENQLATPEQAEAMVPVLGRMIDEATAWREGMDPALRVDTATRIPEYLNKLGLKIEDRTDPGAARTALQNYGRRLVEDSPLSRSTYVAPPPETLEAGLARGIEEARAIEARRAIPAHAAQRPRLINPALKELESQRPPRTGVVRDVPPTSELDELLKRADEETPGRAASRGPVPPVEPQQFTGPGGAFPGSSRPRELNPDIRPSRLVEIIRAKSAFAPGTHPTEFEAARMAERGMRDSLKTAVPATEPMLKAQGRAMDAETLLNRQTWRDANRDTLGLGAIAGFANKAPTIGTLLQLLKESQLRLGLAAGKYGPRIAQSGPRIAGSAPTGATAAQLARVLQLLISGGAQQPPTEP